ncbi:MAG: chemotaxis protein CheW [Aquabacterium sp.]
MVDSRCTSSLLVCRTQARACALPIEHVGEIMRPLPVERLPGVPPYILGLALIRGVATPVVDLAGLLGQVESHIARFVTIKVAGRPLALAVAQVHGIVVVAHETLAALPSLMRDVGADLIESISVRDAALLLVLDGARLLPVGALPQLEAAS